MHSQNILLLNPPPLSQQLRQQADELLCKIVRANYNTQFAQATSKLAEFRRATANSVSRIDDDTLSNIFRKTVQFTTYDAYAPFIRRFHEKPCKAGSIVDLLAPGLPDYLARSSTTSGDLPKFIPRYNCSSKIASSNTGSWTISNPNRRRTTASVRSLWTEQLDVEDETNSPVKKIHLCSASNMSRRNLWNLDPEKDEEKMGTFIRNQSAPYAAGFVKKWQSFVIIQVLFAIASKSLETMDMVYINTFVDMMRHLDKEFDMVVDCIENGTIPHLEGVEDVRHYLEPNLLPDPERAAELHGLGRPSDRPGWCGLVWPKLHSIKGIASGSFTSSVPLAQWYLGPSTDIRSGHYGCTEASVIGIRYDPCELNLFKLTRKTIVEFLDIRKSNDSISALEQLWEVEAGGMYELVLTTQDGLWRYRLGDVVEITGFDSMDGLPIMKFIERYDVIMRIQNIMFTEKELQTAITSALLLNIVEWTVTLDDRQMPSTVGYFVELVNDQVSDLPVLLGAPDQVWDAFSRLNPNILHSFAAGRFGKPTIRVVRPGTFSDFRQLKIDEGSRNIGQIKVPVVLPKPLYVTWFSNRVVGEL